MEYIMMLIFAVLILVCAAFLSLHHKDIYIRFAPYGDFLYGREEKGRRRESRAWYKRLISLPKENWIRVSGAEKEWPSFEARVGGVIIARLSVERFNDLEICEDIVIGSIPVETIERRLVTLVYEGKTFTGCCRYCTKKPIDKNALVDWLHEELKYRIITANDDLLAELGYKHT